MIVERELIKNIAPFLKRREFISIVGPRQAGKTTFLEIIKAYLVDKLNVNQSSIKTLTFEDRKLLLQFERNAREFVNSYLSKKGAEKLYLMIDEFQYAEEGGQKLKLIYDTMKQVKIFVTGSSSLQIKAKVGKFMVGRILNFNLYPFNFREYLRARNVRLERIYAQQNEKVIRWIFKGIKPNMQAGADTFSEEFIQELERFCIWGGYPGIILAETDAERRKLLAEIYNNYILRDIKTLLELATEKNLFLLSQYLATQIGNIVVYQHLSQAANLDYRNLKKHLNILEETFISREVRPFFKNRQKELSKNPKIFFMDLGFRNNLVENVNALEKRSDAGAIIENYCFIRLNEIGEDEKKINFWRTKTGAEVDFILNAGGDIIPVEVKYFDFTRQKISKSFASFLDSFRPGRAVVLTKNYWGFVKRNKTAILFAPIFYL